MTRIAAIITARGGSKGLPGKNLKTVGGASLVARAISSARGCSQITDIVVSTDDSAIKQEAIRCGAEVVDRPTEIAGDRATSEEAVLHALKWLEGKARRPEAFVLLQPTSPLRTEEHVTEALELFLSGNQGCLMSVTPEDHHPYKALTLSGGELTPLVDRASLSKTRQSLPEVYRQNGAIYIVRTELFAEHKSFFVEPVIPYVMPAQASVDVDTVMDLVVCEAILAEQSRAGKAGGGRADLGAQKTESRFSAIARQTGKPIDLKSLNRTISWKRQIADEQRKLSERLKGALDRLLECPICLGDELKPFVNVFGFPYAECAGCGHVFTQTPPNDAAVREIYKGEQGTQNAQALVYLDEAVFQKRIAQIARPKVEFVTKTVPPKDGVWVDVGCANGEMLMAAREKGWRTLGVETDAQEVAFARKQGLEIVQEYLTGANAAIVLGDARVLSCVNVLEHIRDPLGWLSSVAAHLPHGSYVAVEVPRHPSLSSFSNAAFPELACRHIYSPDHLHVFTERSLDLVLRASGLEPVSVWTFGQDFYELISSAAANAGMPEGGFFERVLDLAPILQQKIDEAGFSDVMFVIARRNS